MPRMPMVTCERCGKEFSALRADCPHCGQRRTVGRAEYAVRSARPEQRRSRPQRERRASWQLLLGLALIAAAIVAVALMVLSARSRGSGTYVARPTSTAALQSIAPRPDPTPTPTPTVSNVKIFFLNNEITAEAGGFTMYVGDEPLTISARAYPNDKLYDAPFTWRVSDSSKARLTPSADTQSCEVLPLESAGGYILLTASCYGVDCTVPLYIWAR